MKHKNIHAYIELKKKKKRFLIKKEKNDNKDQIYHLCFGVRF